MTRRRLGLLASAAAAVAWVLVPSQASAGVYTVANCASDPSRHTTEAFGMFTTRGMKIDDGCAPEPKGAKGLQVGNVVSRGKTVKRGAQAVASISAPPGTTFVKYSWSGGPKRSDCRFAIQIWADAPGLKPFPIYNKRA